MEVEVRPAIEPDEMCAAPGPRALCSAAATVPVSREDAEAPVLGQKQWEGVHERSHVEAERVGLLRPASRFGQRSCGTGLSAVSVPSVRSIWASHSSTRA